MTDNNALAQELADAGLKALAAMDDYNEKHGTCIGGPAFFGLGRAVAAWNTRAQPAPATGEVGEPVAWLWRHASGRTELSKSPDFLDGFAGWTETPLYTADMLERLAGQDQWQPIESAPKDQRIRLFAGGREWSECQWQEAGVISEPEYGGFWIFWHCVADEYYAEVINPTHWMPLPNPPAAMKGEG